MSNKMSGAVRQAIDAVHEIYAKEKRERAKRAWCNGVLWVLLRLEDGEGFDSIATKAGDLGVDLTQLRWKHPKDKRKKPWNYLVTVYEFEEKEDD